MVLGTLCSMMEVRKAACFVAVSLVSVVFCSDMLSAKPLKPFRIADWSGRAVVDDQSKQFVHCSANSSNSRGATISYLLNRQYAWTLEFSHPAWNFSPGFTLALALKINDQTLPNQRAIFLSNQTLQIQPSDSLAVFEMLLIGRQLEVQARGVNFHFDLNASDEVLFALVDCVDRQTGRGAHSKPGSSNAKRSTVAKPPVTRDATVVAEAKSLATQIITHAQVPGSPVVASNEITSGQQADATWRTDSVFGGVEVLPASGIAKIDDIAIRIVSQEASACRGKIFAATAATRLDQANVIKATTTCRSSETTTTKYFYGVPREAGGYYVIATSDSGLHALSPDQRPAKLMDKRIGAVITQVLAKLKPRNGEAPE